MEPQVKKDTKIIQNDVKTISDALQTARIALDGYEDIFSDFDPSPYASRLLSYDFLEEIYRRYVSNKKGEFVVTFTLPKHLRSQKTEELIRKRLKDYFRDRIKRIDKKTWHLRKGGIMRVIVGVLISILLFAFQLPDAEPFFLTIFSVLVWYLLWSGYELVFESPGKINVKRDFYEKFLRAKYYFIDEEQVVQNITSNSYR